MKFETNGQNEDSKFHLECLIGVVGITVEVFLANVFPK